MFGNAFHTIRAASTKNVGFFLDNITGAEYIIEVGNALVERGYSCTLFTLGLTYPVGNFGTQQMDNAWEFEGYCFTFDFGLATYLTRCPRQKKIYLYDECLWKKMGVYLYDTVYNVYMHKRLQILTSIAYKDIIEKVWKTPIVIENFTAEELEKKCLNN